MMTSFEIIEKCKLGEEVDVELLRRCVIAQTLLLNIWSRALRENGYEYVNKEYKGFLNRTSTEWSGEARMDPSYWKRMNSLFDKMLKEVRGKNDA